MNHQNNPRSASLDILQALLHSDFPQQDMQMQNNNLPSEPQVMRTKRMTGHRKSSSVSYMVPLQQPVMQQMGHKRTSSYTSVASVDGIDPEYYMDQQQQQQMMNAPEMTQGVPPMPNLGRFNSAGNAAQNPPQYQFNSYTPVQGYNSSNAYQPYPMQQNNIPNTNNMFNDFTVMELEKEARRDNVGQFRPMRRLHPLMTEQSHQTHHSTNSMNSIASMDYQAHQSFDPATPYGSYENKPMIHNFDQQSIPIYDQQAGSYDPNNMYAQRMNPEVYYDDEIEYGNEYVIGKKKTY
jgi:hypothetical protein